MHCGLLGQSAFCFHRYRKKEIKNPAPRPAVIIFGYRVNDLISFQHISGKVFVSNIYYSFKGAAVVKTI